MTLLEIAQDLNTRFATLTGTTRTDHLHWDWDGWAASLNMTVPQMFEKLLYTLQFKRDRFAWRLFEVLEQRPGPETTAFLIETAKTYRWEPERALAARLLGKLRDRSAAPMLIQRLKDARVFKKNQLTTASGGLLSEWAEVIDALGEIGDPTAAWILGQISEEPKADAGIRRRATEALAKLPRE